jgi:hypothetical protein
MQENYYICDEIVSLWGNVIGLFIYLDLGR